MVAQFLAARGFDRVFQLQGGIEAWEQRTAASPPDLHLQYIRGDESAIEAALIAYKFETGLERFYREASGRSKTDEVRDLLEKLTAAEESHAGRLMRLLDSFGASDPSAESKAQVMEGGSRSTISLPGTTVILILPRAVWRWQL